MLENNYPGAYVKYAFELFGKTFESFSCSVANTAIKEIVFEKAKTDEPSDTTFWMTFNFGPVNSLDDARTISDSLKEQILDKLLFELESRIEKARLVEHNVEHRPGEGMHGNMILPALQGHGIINSKPYKLPYTEITKIQVSINKELNNKQNTLLKLYRHGLNINDPVTQFIMLYLILDIITAKNGQSNQNTIDSLILGIDRSTPQSPHPTKKKNGKPVEETIYTRLRNEIIHRECDHEATRNEILNRIDGFKRIVKAALIDI